MGWDLAFLRSGSLLHLIQPDDVGACAALAQVPAAERRALYDALTGLPNHGLLEDRLAQALALDRWPGWLALLFVDFDGLKIVNDSRGHDAGDEMLPETARRLQSVLRSCTRSRGSAATSSSWW